MSFACPFFYSKDGDNDVEYSVMTPVVSVSVAQDGRRLRKHWPTVLTELEFDLTLPPRPVNGTWNVTCATAARLAGLLYQWDVQACRLSGEWSPASNVTRCQCPSAGLFAVLISVAPQVSSTLCVLRQIRFSVARAHSPPPHHHPPREFFDHGSKNKSGPSLYCNIYNNFNISPNILFSQKVHRKCRLSSFFFWHTLL